MKLITLVQTLFLVVVSVIVAPVNAEGEGEPTLVLSPDGDIELDESGGIPKLKGLVNLASGFDLDSDNISIQILPEGETLTYDAKIKTSSSWTGEQTSDGEFGAANFYMSEEGRLTGSLTYKNMVCALASYPGDGEVALHYTCINQRDFKPDGLPLTPDVPPIEPKEAPEGEVAVETKPQEYLDVMVIYTHNAMCGEAGLPFPCDITDENKVPIEDRVKLAVEETNAAYEMSGMTGKMRLVHTYLDEEYDESLYNEGNGHSSNAALNALKEPFDGSLDEAHKLRAQYGADIMTLWLEDIDACGLAYTFYGISDYGLSVMQRDCTTGYWTFGHETAHNMGAKHNRYEYTNDIGDGDQKEYAHAYRDFDSNFRTIVAYVCDLNQNPGATDGLCPKVQRFSTTKATLQGRPLGDETTDNVRQMESVWNVMINWYPAGGIEAGPPQVEGPSPGGTVVDAPVTDDTSSVVTLPEREAQAGEINPDTGDGEFGDAHEGGDVGDGEFGTIDDGGELGEPEAEPEMKACINEYPFWVSCVSTNVRDGCLSTCNIDAPNTCADLMANDGCCPDCERQFQNLVDCSSCDVAEAEMEPNFGNDVSEECATCLMDPTANCEEICMPASEPETEAEAEGSLCSESIAAITKCVARNCPETTKAGGVACALDGVDADTCDDVQNMCNAYADCCGACGVEIAGLLNQCTPGEGGTCNINTCGGTEAEAEAQAGEIDPDTGDGEFGDAHEGGDVGDGEFGTIDDGGELGEPEAEPEMKACINEYPFWVSCVSTNVRDGCLSTCNIDAPNTCADLMANDGCCPDCERQFQNLVDCSSCDVAEAEMEPNFGNDVSEECATCLMDPTANCEEICMPASEPETEAEAEGSLCSESIAAITKCVARNCPETTKAGGVACALDGVDADTCDDVQNMCNAYADCCGACGVEIAGLLNQCTPGEGGTCNINTCGGTEAEAEPEEDPTDSANNIKPTIALLAAALAVMTYGVYM